MEHCETKLYTHGKQERAFHRHDTTTSLRSRIVPLSGALVRPGHLLRDGKEFVVPAIVGGGCFRVPRHGLAQRLALLLESRGAAHGEGSKTKEGWAAGSKNGHCGSDPLLGRSS